MLATHIHQRLLGEVRDPGALLSDLPGAASSSSTRDIAHCRPPLVVEVGIRGQGGLRPTGLDICRRSAEVVDGVWSALIPREPGVYLSIGREVSVVIIRGRAVRPILIRVNQPRYGIDRLVRRPRA